MGRNLCKDCENCEHNEENLMCCIDMCRVPTDLLSEIERARNTYEENFKKIQDVKNYFVNNLFTN